MIFMPSQTVRDINNKVIGELNAYIICEDEYGINFKIIFFKEGIKIKEVGSFNNESVINYNLN